MRTTPREGETFYNEQLITDLKAAYERSDISPSILAELLGCSRAAAKSYVQLTRTIVRSDIERRAVVAIKLLNTMCDKGVLPVDIPKNSPKRPVEVMAVINEYLNTIS